MREGNLISGMRIFTTKELAIAAARNPNSSTNKLAEAFPNVA